MVLPLSDYDDYKIDSNIKISYYHIEYTST